MPVISSDAIHDLAMLYLQQQELLSLTPVEFLDKYLEIRNAIADRANQLDNAKYKEL